MTTENPIAKIGDIVLYRVGGAVPKDPTNDPYYVAAIVTMTPQEWQPGYRDADGEWHETTQVEQPKAHTVHLHAFYPPGIVNVAAEFLDSKHVAYGDGPGQWSHRA